MGPDVVGGMLDTRSLATETGVGLFIPWYILRDGKLDLEKLVRESQQTRPPAHLREWVQKTGPKKKERGDIRYERQAWLYRFLNLALKARYPVQCRGKAEKLDNAFALVLDIDAQSIRKSRQVLERDWRQKSPKGARALDWRGHRQCASRTGADLPRSRRVKHLLFFSGRSHGCGWFRLDRGHAKRYCSPSWNSDAFFSFI